MSSLLMRFGRALSPWGAFFFPFDAAFAAVRGSGAEPAGFAVARVREDERKDRGAVEEDAMGVGDLARARFVAGFPDAVALGGEGPVWNERE